MTESVGKDGGGGLWLHVGSQGSLQTTRVLRGHISCQGHRTCWGWNKAGSRQPSLALRVPGCCDTGSEA